MKKFIFTLALMSVILNNATAQEQKRRTDYGQDETIVIWDNNKAPHSNGLTGEAYEIKTDRLVNTTKTVLYVFNADPTKATGQAVVVCPGGGYAKLSMSQEGYMMAQWLAKSGISAFLLEYRLPNGHKEVPLEDAVEATQILKFSASQILFNDNLVGRIISVTEHQS